MLAERGKQRRSQRGAVRQREGRCQHPGCPSAQPGDGRSDEADDDQRHHKADQLINDIFKGFDNVHDSGTARGPCFGQGAAQTAAGRKPENDGKKQTDRQAGKHVHGDLPDEESVEPPVCSGSAP